MPSTEPPLAWPPAQGIVTLTREHLEEGLIRRLASARPGAARCLADAELDASIASLLAEYCPQCDIWVFAYGSLIWNPLFRYAERHPVRLDGYHRRFCLWSMTGRGTPDAPGLVLGLDRGGRCKGLAYRISRGDAAEELRLLWRREMVVGSYSPRWVDLVDARSRRIRGIAFIVNRSHPHYAGRLSTERIAQVMSAARGVIGANAEYLRKTVHGLAEHGIHDPHLAELHARLFGADAERDQR